ncbi:MAG: SPFH domain-containing protein [Spirochaetaceae bacterium]|nr:SPFH domain-containing protein [Spirochaetaceae bacterium]
MEEKILNGKKNGFAMLLLLVVLLLLGIAGIIAVSVLYVSYNIIVSLIFGCGLALSIILVVIAVFSFAGLKVLAPQEALVLTLFGKYVGTLKGEGFYFVNPFCTGLNTAKNTKLAQSGDASKQGTTSITVNQFQYQITFHNKISLKSQTLSNAKQKINDVLGNPVEISVAVIWRVVDTAKAVFNVENYKEFLSLQCDTAIRDIVQIYPYDVAPGIDTTGDGMSDDGSLRGSSTIVADRIKQRIQENVEKAGLIIEDARITYLAYAPEIAQAMLQRQQATAIVDARKLIVDGAVGMVEMALNELSKKEVVVLDDERKAQMVSNLLVVLCGNRDAQPIVNSGTLY